MDINVRFFTSLLLLSYSKFRISFLNNGQVGLAQKASTDWQTGAKRTVLKENSNSYDHLHLWYSTSEVIHALELFIMGEEELSGSSIYRLAFWSFKTCAEYTSSSCDYHKLGTLLVYSGVRNSFYLIWCSLDLLLHPQLRLG